MNITTPSKQDLTIKCNELCESLDQIIADISARRDEKSAEQLAKAMNLYQDLKFLEPAIDALND